MTPPALEIEVRAGPGAEALGAVPGAPIVGGMVDVAPAEPPREIVSATTDESGVARVDVPGSGSYLVSLTHNVDGGAFLADQKVEIAEGGQRIVLEARTVVTATDGA